MPWENDYDHLEVYVVEVLGKLRQACVDYLAKPWQGGPTRAQALEGSLRDAARDADRSGICWVNMVFDGSGVTYGPAYREAVKRLAAEYEITVN